MRGRAAHSWYGMDALPERFAANGPDGEECGEGAGEDEMDLAFAICWHSHGPRDTGTGGCGFASVILCKTDEANDKRETRKYSTQTRSLRPAEIYRA